MKRRFPTAALLAGLFAASICCAQGQGAPSPRGPLAAAWEEAFARMHPFDGKRLPGADPSTLNGKVICGYQGWFMAEGDGSGAGWVHYGPSDFKPGKCTVDLWPDMSDAGPDERYPTPFQLADGSTATVFSSYNAKTVDRHFKWMAGYGIDGAFLQRFGTTLRFPKGYDHLNAILDNVRRGANNHGRTWAVMYDLSGLQPGEIESVIMEDWKRLFDKMKITADPSYQHQGGKPVVTIWGVGFDDGRKYTLDECGKLIDFLKYDPRYGGNCVMLGVPYGWREQIRDTVADPKLHEVILKADIVSPWAVGRYRTPEQFAGNLDEFAGGDLAWCRMHKLDYMPVIFPGFRWGNLMAERGKPDHADIIDRAKGEFFKSQGDDLVSAGAKMIYVAMFDEIDEGTAIFKCTNNPPVGASAFGSFDGMPTDTYLRLAGNLSAELKKAGKRGGIDFAGEFAPSESWVKAPEKPLRDDICLNGSWQFQPVALPPDFRQGSDPAPALPPPSVDAWDVTPLKVPSAWNANSFADEKGQGGDFRVYPSYPRAWENAKMGWLRRSFTVPASWKGRRVLIHFAAAAGDLQFEINEKDAGSRFDIFFPFDLDVTGLVQFGATNEILVGVRKPELFNVNGKYGNRTYQAGSFWGQHVVGLWQDVDLVAVPAARVADVFVQPQVDGGILKVQIALRNDGGEPANVDLSAAAYPWISTSGKSGPGAAAPNWKLGPDAALKLTAVAAVIPPHGEKTVTLERKAGHALRFWTPGDPQLYGLLVDVKSAGQLVDRKYTRFGWRQVTLGGSQVLLNGKPFVLKGDSWHFLGVPQMTRRYAQAWFTALRDANLNAVRLHAEPYPEFYLDVADEMGIMVLDETAIWASDGGPKLDSDIFWKDTEDHIGRLVLRDRNHPSVFGWSACNEVKPVVQNVFHNPPGMYDKLLAMYPVWADIIRRLDPTRSWISADGDDDAGGNYPAYVIHYGDTGTMQRASQSGKPWGVGEAGGAYYMTPQQVAKTNGGRAYASFEDRMEGIAADSYKHLLNQRKYGASYHSVFNLVWYGLQPMPLGMNDTTRPPTINDGIFFPPFVEGKPGEQPERLGPYCTTLNPGYDPGLPLYKTWPLFNAIKDSQAEPPVAFSFDNSSSAATPEPAPPVPVKSAGLLAGPDGKLRDQLSKLGVVFNDKKTTVAPEFLFIDGINPPDTGARTTMDSVLAAGGTVMIWGVDSGTIGKLNALLPDPLELTARKSSSLIIGTADPVTARLKLSDLYFSESTPPVILDGGLGGPFAKKCSMLLQACDTDWLKWNRKPEYAKTAMVLRSELESKPPGAALIEFKQGHGRLLVCNLPAGPDAAKAQALDRRLLQNLGVPLQSVENAGDSLLKNGRLVRVLAAGRFPAADGGAGKAVIDPAKFETIRENTPAGDKRWTALSAGGDAFDMRKLDGPGENAVSYLSFWVWSPRALDNLLPEPNVPRLDLEMQGDDSVEIWLNGKSAAKNPAPDESSGAVRIQGLSLQQGWNHFLVRLAHGSGDDRFSAKFVCIQPDFLNQFKSATQKP